MPLNTWGGKRKGAGRKGSGRTYVPHRPRPTHRKHEPVHVTLRVRPGLPSFRERLFDLVRDSLVASRKDDFRVCEFSVQANHLHLIVEADSSDALARGIQGLCIRTAKAINRVLRRTGSVFDDHYHAHPLRTPTEVRNGLVYVLQNWRKHLPGTPGIDGASSGKWFTGWRDAQPHEASPLPTAKTWLLRQGWRKRGLLSVRESPRAVFTVP